MSTSSQASSSIRLEAGSLSWGGENCDTITPVAGMTGGESFLIATPNAAYQVWFTVNGAGAAPTPAGGETLLVVEVPTAYTVADATAAIKTALELVEYAPLLAKEFRAVDNTTSINVESIFVGAPLAATADVDSGFTFLVARLGFGGELGRTKSALEVTTEVGIFEVKSNQTGDTTLSELPNSFKSTVSADLIELTEERIELIFGNGFGGKDIVDGETVVGYGSDKLFKSTFSSAGKLIIHPVRLDASDRSKDLVYHKTLPNIESLNYDGTDSQTLAVTFNALLDDSINTKFNLFMIGDWTNDIKA